MITTGLTTEQRATYRAASRELHAARFQIRLMTSHRATRRTLIASRRRSGRTTVLRLKLHDASGAPLTLTSWTRNLPDGDSYFALDQAAEAVATAIEIAKERV